MSPHGIDLESQPITSPNSLYNGTKGENSSITVSIETKTEETSKPDGNKNDATSSPCGEESDTRSYTSKNPNPPPWIKVPSTFSFYEEGELVLLLQPGKKPEGPYVIKTDRGNGRYELHGFKGIVYEDELKHPDRGKK